MCHAGKESSIVHERDCILARMIDYFRSKAGTVGMFTRGSIAEGAADAWSDIDFAVVVADEYVEQYISERHSAPAQWGELLFNSGIMGRNMGISHFAPFVKVDVFYYRPREIVPSPWLARPVLVHYDKSGNIQAAIEASKSMRFEADVSAVNKTINQAMSSAHEVIRRVERGELAFAQSILASLRQDMAELDDMLHDRPPVGLPRFERRCNDPQMLDALTSSHPAVHEPACILAAVKSIVPALQRQISKFQDKLPLGRDNEKDNRSLSLVAQWKLC